MTSAEAVLQKAADDGSLDPSEWPETLQFILNRLDEIINDFPRPPPQLDPSPSSPSPSRQQPAVSSQGSAAGDKENAAPTTPSRPPVPAFSFTTTTGFPQDTINAYSAIRKTLATNFSKDAPHTIQRLAELILQPKLRYHYLPPYLRALDRVVSVSSPNSIFPLPQAVLPTAPSLLNGTSATPSLVTLGSDESLGGALLTPIPWLQSRGAQSEFISESTEMVDGPNGAGRIETVTVGMLNAANSAANNSSNGGAGAGTAAAGAATTASYSTEAGASSSTPPASSSTSPYSSASPTSTTSSSAQGVSQIASSHPDGETLPSTGAVTQGEILRQEQEAGVVLNNPHSMSGSGANRPLMGELEHHAAMAAHAMANAGGRGGNAGAGPAAAGAQGNASGQTILPTIEGDAAKGSSTSTTTGTTGMNDAPDAPHARGPEIIGMEDMGPQPVRSSGRGKGLDIEGAVGRPSLEREGRSPGPSSGAVASAAGPGHAGAKEKDGGGDAEGEDSHKVEDERMAGS